MRFAFWSLIASAVGIASSFASLKYGIFALAPIVGFEGFVIWYARKYRPEDWNRD